MVCLIRCSLELCCCKRLLAPIIQIQYMVQKCCMVGKQRDASMMRFISCASTLLLLQVPLCPHYPNPIYSAERCMIGGSSPPSNPAPGAASPFPAMPSFPQSQTESPGPPSSHDAQSRRARQTWHSAQGEEPAVPQHQGRGSFANGVPGEEASSPSAPPLFSQHSHSDLTGAQADQSQGEEAQCVICLSAPRECGFLHGSSMHLCVCRDCKRMTPPGQHCPLCRQTIERVIDVF
ncbi:hypothetical protein DUNSADRAFT_13560 [Dunaliella salina]|uniref:RING-type domain-containing protein n=1 Tax=Dunaliella salina TaxID=3046 RepID=A0ABQ7H353_DUNSA|nr:hypothetical protein DUNSADRAFT_13560 [Dunaliella salina]|eukprot:KAF5841287.1 hypothetical protein DUNSADRAFT_13560 [Dunaliella salina]